MSLLINKAISNILTTSTELKNKVGSNIYALIAPDSVTFPFIVYKRNNLTPEYSKDGLAYNNTDIQVIIGAANYTDSVEVAQLVRNSLELKKGIFAGINIIECKLTSAEEDFVENSFAQSLTFSIKSL
nr:DUF3168 domain-containing protein [uncultured Bacteroides sp.]